MPLFHIQKILNIHFSTVIINPCKSSQSYIDLNTYSFKTFFFGLCRPVDLAQNVKKQRVEKGPETHTDVIKRHTI